MGWVTAVWLVLAGAVAGLAAALLVSDIKLDVSVKRENEDDTIRLSLVMLFGLVRRQIAIPLLKWEGMSVKLVMSPSGPSGQPGVSRQTMKIDREKVKKSYRQFLQLLQATYQLKKWVRDTARRVRCTELVWTTQIGLGDAADTAMAAGAVWGVKSPLVGFVSGVIRLQSMPQLAVMPLFNEMHFETVFRGKFRIRLGAALLSIFRLGWRVLRIRGGLRRWWGAFSRMRAGDRGKGRDGCPQPFS